MTASVSTISRSGSRKGYGKGRRKKVPSWGTLGGPNPTLILVANYYTSLKRFSYEDQRNY